VLFIIERESLDFIGNSMSRHMRPPGGEARADLIGPSSSGC
jgi:hypothetical protein